MKINKTSKSEYQTQKIGESLARSLKAGDIVALYGNLGSGKTVFVKGIARGLGIKKRILSPTFVFIRSYPLTINHKLLTLYHIDLYRGQSLEDFEALGLEEIFSKNNIVVIEWADRIAKMLPRKRIDVFIDRMGENTRRIKIVPVAYSSSDRAKRGNREVTLRTSISSNGKFSTSLNIKKAASILKNGRVVIFPTDTVYGVGCRYDNQKAVDRIYKIKSTPKNQPFPILVSSIKQVENLAIITPAARKLMEKYWPGGLTIILNPQKGSQKMGFRMPNQKELLSVIYMVDVPIIGTSANFHGQPSVSSFEDLDPKLIKLADFVIKGKSGGGIESTVIDTTVNPPKILRQGAVKLIY